MKVFVTGGSGYIGHAIVRALVRAGHEVVALHHSRESAALEAEPKPRRWVQGDLAQPAGWLEHARAADALVHAGMDHGPTRAAIDRTALDALLEAAKGAKAPRTLIYTSGVWVLGN